MTLAVSTSSPLVSVALIEGGEILGFYEQEAQGAASAAVAELASRLLKTAGKTMQDVTEFVVDVGPGGFTGVKVGVTFLKALAWAKHVSISTVSAFDLIDSQSDVAIPSKRNEWYLRKANGPAQLVAGEAPNGAIGYGPGFESPRYPSVKNLTKPDVKTQAVDVLSVVPCYIAEPSVSAPKNPHVLKGVIT